MIRDSRFHLGGEVWRQVGFFVRPQVLRCGLLSALLSAAAFGQCTYTVTPGPNVYVDANGTIDLAGDPLVVQVTASAQNCSNPWTVTPAAGSFASVASSTGNSGNGSFTLSVPVNSTGAARTTTLSLTGPSTPITITLKQDLTVTKFADVLPNGPERNYFDGINLLAQNGITSGVGTNGSGQPLYGPAQNVTRGQMAVFIIATIFNGTTPVKDTFTYSPTPYFTDVPASSSIFKFVQKMRDLGIAAGETATTYGPNLPITREQMAVFITLARLGPQTTFTWSETQQFSDVPPTGATAPYFKYVQKLAEMGITAGCTSATQTTLAEYCPSGTVTRDQMAVFLVVGGFNLLTPNAPIISSVSPNSGAPPSQTVTITGINTHFDTTNNPTTTTILPTAGVTASTPIVTSPTSLTVTFTIPLRNARGPHLDHGRDAIGGQWLRNFHDGYLRRCNGSQRVHHRHGGSGSHRHGLRAHFGTHRDAGYHHRHHPCFEPGSSCDRPRSLAGWRHCGGARIQRYACQSHVRRSLHGGDRDDNGVHFERVRDSNDAVHGGSFQHVYDQRGAGHRQRDRGPEHHLHSQPGYNQRLRRRGDIRSVGIARRLDGHV